MKKNKESYLTFEEELLVAVYYNNVKSGDSTNREGVAAKIYWKKLMIIKLYQVLWKEFWV